MRGIAEIVRIVAGFLNQESIPYAFVRAISVGYYGSPRTTADIDLIVWLENKLDAFVGFLKANDFTVSKEDVRQALKEKSHFTVFDEQSSLRLDVKGVYTEQDKETLARRRKVQAFGTQFYLNSPEDAILFKLLFGSPQDLFDAKTILLNKSLKLDEKYLKEKTRELKLQKKYQQLLSELKQ